MKTLLLLRHGKSNWDDEDLPDHDRPLSTRGKEAAKRVGRLLAEQRLVPDLLVSSTAVRARATAEKVAKKSRYERAIELERKLYLASAATWFDVIRHALDDRKRVLAVGHNPGISEFLNRLTGADEEMPTGALAQVELPIDHWKSLTEKTKGKLVNIWRPRELDS
jgi:phosphohistidine phosphatase